jgi:hypothetical protein
MMMSARRLIPVLLVVVGVLVFGVGSAGAAPDYGLYKDACSGLGDPAFCATATDVPVGVAVDNSATVAEGKGDVYVVSLGAGSGESTVTRFTAAGAAAPFSSTGSDQIAFGAANPREAFGVAVESATGDFYVTLEGANIIDRFEASGKAAGSFSLPEGGPSGIAVDNSSEPSQGDIYVADDGSGKIYQYNHSGVLIGEIPDGSVPQTIAVDQHGNLYVSNVYDNVEEFNSSDAIVKVLDEGHEAEAVTVNPGTGDILVLDNVTGSTGYIQPYSEAGVALQPFGGGEGLGYQAGYGIAASAETNDVYATSTSTDVGTIFAEPIGPTAAPSELVSEPASAITFSGADLNGKFNPGATASYYFEYGTSPCQETNPTTFTCGTKTTVEGPRTGEAQQPVSPTEVSGLTSGETYYYWIVATNSDGTVHGQQETFTVKAEGAPEEVLSEPASEVRPARVDLNGKLNPDGVLHSTEYYFEYGTSPCQETNPTTFTCGAKTAEAGPLTGSTQAAVTALRVTGLISGTTYHYWIVATNSFGSTHGQERSVTTTTGETPTLLSTEPAEEVLENSAYLAGELNPGGGADYYFEYGTQPCTSTSCGTRTVEEGPASGETKKVIESIPVTSLQPGTTYYYWIVATNSHGTTHGAQKAFTTQPAAAVLYTPPTTSTTTTPVTTTTTTTTTKTTTTTPKKTSTPKTLTRAQKLAGALKQCRKEKQKGKRARCEKQAKKKYPVAKPKRGRK